MVYFDTDMSATPILNMLQDPPTPRSKKWAILLGVAAGAAIGLAPASLGRMLPGLNPILWIPCLYVAIAIHELGHLAGGKMAGMAPGGLVVGGFVMMKSGNHWIFRFDYRRILGGGMAVPQPVKGKFQVAGFAWMVAAGPIASILSTLVCWITFLKYGSGTWDWIGSLFWASAMGLFSLIPISFGLHKSDAARLWLLLKRRDQAEAWMAAIAIQAENANGVRPREWDSAMVEQMLSIDETRSGRIFPELMAYFRNLDEQNESAALEHLEIALAASASSGKAVRQALFFEAAEANALLICNAVNARAWRDRALKLRKPESAACCDGAVAMCEGRFGDALQSIERARALLVKRKLDSGLARFAKERLDQRERVCKQALCKVSGSSATTA
jgi:hypothetical protein